MRAELLTIYLFVEKMKNPFKKTAITDTLVAVGVGGAANAAMDYAVANVEALSSVSEYANYIKLGVGVLGGTMVSGKIARAAFDGLATVGASDIIKELIASSAAPAEPTAGAPFIGAARRHAARGYRPVRGTGNVAFMS